MSDNNKLVPKINEVRKLLERTNARRLAVACLIRGLRARRSFYDAGSKSTKNEEDFKTQVQAAELILAYSDGKPIERKEIVETRIDSMTALSERVRKSPELLRTMRKMVEDAENEGGKVVEMKSAQVVGNKS